MELSVFWTVFYVGYLAVYLYVAMFLFSMKFRFSLVGNKFMIFKTFIWPGGYSHLYKSYLDNVIN